MSIGQLDRHLQKQRAVRYRACSDDETDFESDEGDPNAAHLPGRTIDRGRDRTKSVRLNHHADSLAVYSRVALS